MSQLKICRVVHDITNFACTFCGCSGADAHCANLCAVTGVTVMFCLASPRLFILCRGVKKNGGKVRMKSHVERILIEGGRAVGVLLKDGQVIRASKAVVSNASMWDTIRLLPQEHVPPSYRKQARVPSQPHPIRHISDTSDTFQTNCQPGSPASYSPALHIQQPIVCIVMMPAVSARAAHGGGGEAGVGGEQVDTTPINRSFMHLHLGFDAAGEARLQARCVHVCLNHRLLATHYPDSTVLVCPSCSSSGS